MSEEIKKGSDKYLMFAEDLQESIYKFGFDYVVDLILDLQQKVEQLEKELKEANDSISWWSNRFKAVERDNKQLENIRKEAREFVKNNKDKTIAPYGDNEDTDYEVCLFEEDINDLLNILNKGSDHLSK